MIDNFLCRAGKLQYFLFLWEIIVSTSLTENKKCIKSLTSTILVAKVWEPPDLEINNSYTVGSWQKYIVEM